MSNSLALSTLLLISLTAWAQAPVKLASLQGTVVDALTGAPIPRAHVILMSTRGSVPAEFGALTTPDGRFSIERITPGNYIVLSERIGYAVPRGSRRIETLILQPDDHKVDFGLKLTPTGAVFGRVTDADGEPMDGVRVVAVGATSQEAAVTDTKGRYRISGLAAGRYLIKAEKTIHFGGLAPEVRTDGTREMLDATTYYPGSLDPAGASRVIVRPAAEAAGIDIRMVRAPLVRVSGRVSGASQGLVTFQAKSGIKSSVALKKDGMFETWRLDPGRYSVTMEPQDNAGSTLAEIEVASSNVDGIDLQFLPGAEIAGRLEFDDDKAKTPPDKVKRSMVLTSEDLASSLAPVDENNSFRLSKVLPGRYRVTLNNEPAYPKSIRFGSRIFEGNLLDLSSGTAGGDITLVISSALGSVGGSVKDDSPAPTRVTLVSDLNRPAGSTLVKPDGSYLIDNVKPGSYRIVALPESESGAFLDYDDFMEPVEVKAADKTTKDLRLPVR